jgi:hypothetical protein
MKSIRILKQYGYNSKVELQSNDFGIFNGSNIGSSYGLRHKSWRRLELVFIDKNNKEEK